MITKFEDFKLFEMVMVQQHTKINYNKIQGITESSEFKNWFKGSKTTLKGNPIIFFHGTKQKFDTFDKSFISSATDAGFLGKGFYFYTDYNEARQYGNVSAYILKALKPYTPKISQVNKLADLNSDEASSKFTEKVLQKGYDSISYDDDMRGEFVVFDSNQIWKLNIDVSEILF